MKTAICLWLALAGACWELGCKSQAIGGHPADAGEAPPEAGADRQISEPYCPADGAGGGECPVNFCGRAASAASIPPNGYPQSGANVLCNMGRVCVVGAVVDTGDAFQLECMDPTAGALTFGAACSPDPAAGKRCAADGLCVTSADFPASPFCSALCRNDADCPADADGPARCLEHRTAALPNGSSATVGMCTPKSKITGTACLRERDCAAGEGCVGYGPRTNLRVCRAATGTKALGTLCAGNSDCRSGECYDRDFHFYGGQRAYCSGACSVNSDCGPDQRCVRLVVGNNGTPDDPLDDVVAGYCQTLFPPTVAAACASDADCVARKNGSDTCETAHGLCYRGAALPGDACSADTDCPLGGTCAAGSRFVGGYCQTFGCAASATTGADACPAGAVCAQRGPDQPIFACYAGCGTGTSDCKRAGEGYVCVAATSGQSSSICLSGNGT